MIANTASSAPPPTDPELEDAEDSAARQTEEFLANLAYDLQNDDNDGYESPDAETVQITANTAFSYHRNGHNEYLLPDVVPELVPFDVEEFMLHLDYSSPLHNGHWSDEGNIVVINANMMTSDDLLICPQDGKVVPPSPNGKEESTRLSTTQATFLNELRNRPRSTWIQKQADEVPLSYAEVFQAELISATDINRHEALIYQPGFSPDELRSSVKLMLRSTNQSDEMEDFDPRNIPPEDVDPQTHLVLHSLLDERNKDKVAVHLARQAELESLDPSCALDREKAKLLRAHIELDNQYALSGTARNDTNRTMHHVFSNAAFPVHQNNFAMYCKPHLHNLPPSTAVELQKRRLELKNAELPPYRPIQLDALPEPTVPTFVIPLGVSKATPTLVPRAQWMKDTPPFLTDTAADAAYNAACAWTFGTGDPDDFMQHASRAMTPGTLAWLQPKSLSAVSAQPTVSPGTTAISAINDVTAKQQLSHLGDIRHPDHPHYASSQELRRRITHHLNNQDTIHDFHKRYIPKIACSPQTVSTLTSLITKRDQVEKAMENLIKRVSPNGTPLHPSVNTEQDEKELEMQIHDLNRLLFCEFVVFLASSPTKATIPSTLLEPHVSERLTLAAYDKASINTPRNRMALRKFHRELETQTLRSDPFQTEGMLENLIQAKDEYEAAIAMQPEAAYPRARPAKQDLSAAIQQRIQQMGSPSYNTSTDTPLEFEGSKAVKQPQRKSSRARPTKRSRYEPAAMGQGPKDAFGLHVASDAKSSQHLIVDTGASHVLFRLHDS